MNDFSGNLGMIGGFVCKLKFVEVVDALVAEEIILSYQSSVSYCKEHRKEDRKEDLGDVHFDEYSNCTFY